MSICVSSGSSDIATFGKAVANGMPISIIAGKSKFMKEFNNIFFSMTFGGEVCSIASALATVRILKTKDYGYIWDQGLRFQKAFDTHSNVLGLDARTVGHAPWHNIQFNVRDAQGAKDLFHQEMVKRGILMGKQIYFTFAHKPKHVTKTINAAKDSLDVVFKAIQEDDIDKYLEGSRSQLIFKRS